MKSMIKFIMSLLILLVVSGCGNKASEKLEFKVYTCDYINDKCHDEYEIWEFKTKSYENTVYLKVYNSLGDPVGNAFFEDCKFYNKNNWSCRRSRSQLSISMVEGNLVTDNSKGSIWNEGDHYVKYVKVY